MKNPPEGWPRISPSLFYDDSAAAIDWLVRAFGFEVRERVEDDEGRVVHSQLVLDGGLVMVGQAGPQPDREYQKSPRAVGGANTQSLAVYVDDADAHCERARAAGAEITIEPATQDYGEGYWVDRSYGALDLEGHHWWFLQRLMVPPAASLSPLRAARALAGPCLQATPPPRPRSGSSDTRRRRTPGSG